MEIADNRCRCDFWRKIRYFRPSFSHGAESITFVSKSSQCISTSHSLMVSAPSNRSGHWARHRCNRKQNIMYSWNGGPFTPFSLRWRGQRTLISQHVFKRRHSVSKSTRGKKKNTDSPSILHTRRRSAKTSLLATRPRSFTRHHVNSIEFWCASAVLNLIDRGSGRDEGDLLYMMMHLRSLLS